MDCMFCMFFSCWRSSDTFQLARLYFIVMFVWQCVVNDLLVEALDLLISSRHQLEQVVHGRPTPYLRGATWPKVGDLWPVGHDHPSHHQRRPTSRAQGLVNHYYCLLLCSHRKHSSNYGCKLRLEFTSSPGCFAGYWCMESLCSMGYMVPLSVTLIVSEGMQGFINGVNNVITVHVLFGSLISQLLSVWHKKECWTCCSRVWRRKQKMTKNESWPRNTRWWSSLVRCDDFKHFLLPTGS